MKYILGVDAGNSKTIALVARVDGTIVGSGRGGCGDIYNAGSPKKALRNVEDAINAAMLSAGCRRADVLVAAFSMAGADWPEDFSVIDSFITRKKYGKKTVIVNDAIGALKAGAMDDWGVAIANGTGAAISARSPDGKVWQTSWWQEGGGGRSLGERALRAIYRSELGIVGETLLTRRVLSYYALPNVEALLHRFTRRVDPDMSGGKHLARLVLDAADEGDNVAREIVIAEGQNLGDYILVAARKVGIDHESFPLIMTGSIFKHPSSVLTDAILERVNSGRRTVEVHMCQVEPCVGALVVALQTAGNKVEGVIRSRLQSTMPQGEFFHT